MQQPIGKACLRFQRMAKGMPQVQQRALPARFELVLADDPRLGRDGMRDRIAARIRVTRQQASAIRLAPIEECGVIDQAIFDDLGITRPHLSRGQRIEDIGVDQHDPRLVERADQILAGARVDPGLATDRRIDLRQQGGGNLYEAAAALQDRGGETDQVTDHPAAQRDHVIAALHAQFQQAIGQPFQHRPAFGRFAGGEDDRLVRDARARQRGGQRRQMRRDMFVSDDRHRAPSGQRREDVPRLAKQSGLDPHVVAAFAQLHTDRRHCRKASRIARTVVSCGACALGTRIGASA